MSSEQSTSTAPSGKRKIRLNKWLLKMLHDKVPGIGWHDKNEGIFKISWEHAKKKDRRVENDRIFEEWAINSGQRGQGGLSYWKHCLGSALYSNYKKSQTILPWTKEVTGCDKGGEFRYYKFAQEEIQITSGDVAIEKQIPTCVVSDKENDMPSFVIGYVSSGSEPMSTENESVIQTSPSNGCSTSSESMDLDIIEELSPENLFAAGDGNKPSLGSFDLEKFDSVHDTTDYLGQSNGVPQFGSDVQNNQAPCTEITTMMSPSSRTITENGNKQAMISNKITNSQTIVAHPHLPTNDITQISDFQDQVMPKQDEVKHGAIVNHILSTGGKSKPLPSNLLSNNADSTLDRLMQNPSNLSSVHPVMAQNQMTPIHGDVPYVNNQVNVENTCTQGCEYGMNIELFYKGELMLQHHVQNKAGCRILPQWAFNINTNNDTDMQEKFGKGFHDMDAFLMPPWPQHLGNSDTAKQIFENTTRGILLSSEDNNIFVLRKCTSCVYSFNQVITHGRSKINKIERKSGQRFKIFDFCNEFVPECMKYMNKLEPNQPNPSVSLYFGQTGLQGNQPLIMVKVSSCKAVAALKMISENRNIESFSLYMSAPDQHDREIEEAIKRLNID